jgi:hypothetical protein
MLEIWLTMGVTASFLVPSRILGMAVISLSAQHQSLQDVCRAEVFGGEFDQRPHLARQDAAFQVDGT